jgi:hypothetical protein
MTNNEIRLRSAGSVIKRFLLRKYREKKRELLEIKSAIVIQRHVRGRKARTTSFRRVLQIDRYPRIFFLKEQKPLFLRILRELAFLIEAKYDLRYEEVVSLVREDD